MTIFVFCVNLLVAAFVLTFIAEISTLMIGGLMLTFDCIKNRRTNNDKI